MRLIILFFILINCSESYGKDATQIKNYYGTYQIEGEVTAKPTTSLSEPAIEVWSSFKEAEKLYRLAALFPHFKNPFWVTVNHVFLNEAKEFGPSAELFLARKY